VRKLLGLKMREAMKSWAALSPLTHIPIYALILPDSADRALLLGQILAEMGMCAGREVSSLPSYGPEMRSGSAHCYVCLANERVGSPLGEHPDVLIAMNEISLHKFAKHVGPHGTILFNSSKLPDGFPPHEAMIYCVPAAEIADKLGAIKATNMVMLGALLELTHTLPKESAVTLLQAKV
jgi:Pyruvate/2-oxoacid:ferredoxin oxidoreductase gamma subunit